MTLQELTNKEEAVKAFKEVHNKANWITPSLHGIYGDSKTAIEISYGKVSEKTLYAVTVVQNGTTNFELSNSYNSLDKARQAAVNILRAEKDK